MGFLSNFRGGLAEANRALDDLRAQAESVDPGPAYDQLMDQVVEMRAVVAEQEAALTKQLDVMRSGVKDHLGGLVTEVRQGFQLTEQAIEDFRRSGSIGRVEQDMLNIEARWNQTEARMAQGAAAISEQMRHAKSLIEGGKISLEELKQNTASYGLGYVDRMIDRTGEISKQLRDEILPNLAAVDGQITSAVAKLKGAEDVQDKLKGAVEILNQHSDQYNQRIAQAAQALDGSKEKARELMQLVDQVQAELSGLERGGPGGFDNLAGLLRDVARESVGEDFDESARGSLY